MSVERTILLVLIVCSSVTLGCTPASNVVPVSGKVTFKGAPCDGALVVFHPSDKSNLNDPKPVATTAADGSYKLTTVAVYDGAAPGNYGVTIVWNANAKEAKLSLSSEGGGGTDKLQGRYGNPAQPQLSAKVATGQENIFVFDLK